MHLQINGASTQNINKNRLMAIPAHAILAHNQTVHLINGGKIFA
jgi:hypothetical protein